MWRWTPAALAAALLIAAPTNASAVPVPPPDVDPVEECTESGVCPSTLTVDVTVNGVSIGTLTCPLELEVTAQFTGFWLFGNYFIYVEAGWALCDYGICGIVAGGYLIAITGTF
jgi:hypothetical protein